MESKPGTYALVLKSGSAARVTVGRWGILVIRPGFYIYVGSAFGPGGVLSRVTRHCRTGRSKHWHIDFLRAFTVPVSIWYSHAPTRLEHRWAEALGGLEGMAPVKGFGCSDCCCETHLFFTAAEPVLAAFARAVGGPIASCRCAAVV